MGNCSEESQAGKSEQADLQDITGNPPPQPLVRRFLPMMIRKRPLYQTSKKNYWLHKISTFDLPQNLKTINAAVNAILAKQSNLQMNPY